MIRRFANTLGLASIIASGALGCNSSSADLENKELVKLESTISKPSTRYEIIIEEGDSPHKYLICEGFRGYEKVRAKYVQFLSELQDSARTSGTNAQQISLENRTLYTDRIFVLPDLNNDSVVGCKQKQ